MNKKITIQQWFNTKFLLPILQILCLFFVLLFLNTATIFHEFNARQKSVVTQFKDTALAALYQKNRPMLDLALHSLKDELSASSITICEKNIIVDSLPQASTTICPQASNSFNQILSRYSFDDNDNFYLIIIAPHFLTKGIVIANIFTSLLLFCLVFMLTTFVKKRVRQDILQPLFENRKNTTLILIKEIEDTIIKQEEWLKLKSQEVETIALYKIGTQVAHDIRSPLAALDMAVKETNELPEEVRLIIRNSVSRIRDIANNLLAKNRAKGNSSSEETQEKIETILLSSAIESLISEKRMQFRSKLGVQINFDLSTESYGLFAKIELREFKRMISNIINNSVEAFESNGEIKVSLISQSDKIEIKIIDNGKGIPPDVLEKLGKKGETFGKKEGNGLGLYHARTTLESWGGSLKLESAIGIGTTTTLTLIKASSPSWFVRELNFKKSSRIVVIDDDSSIHQIWDGRFQSSLPHDAEIEIIHLSNPELARIWFKENENKKETCYLVDFEFLGSDSNGLTLIKELKIEKQAILVTSRYEEEHILTKCLADKISLIPKNLSAFIPIHVSVPSEYFEYVYIEDDMLLRMGWERVAKKKKIKLLTLESPRLFEFHHDNINPETTKIYIDSSLGENEIKGEDFAAQLHNRGFKHLYIATGYEKEKFAHLSWLKHSGKNCPFEDED